MKKIINIGVIALGVVFSFWACGLSDVNSFLFDANKERELGNEFDKTLRDSIPKKFLGENHEFSLYVNKLKDSIVSKIDNETWDHVLPDGNTKQNFFSVAVIDENIANAFAVPGGYFYLYTGILSTMNDESELVAVMGHEIGHVLAHHSRDRIIQATAATAALDVFLGGDGGATELIANLGVGYFLTQNGQDDELEADAYGVKFAKAVGVKPTGISTYFGKDIVDAKGNCDDGSFVEGILDVFSTHPPNCERVKESNKLIASFDPSVNDYPTNKTRYDNKVKTLP